MTAVPTDSRRVPVILAIIMLVGVLATAIFPNWDKLFPKKNLIQATYSGYRPTGNFETEFRYYFDVSGSRQDIESGQRQLLSNLKTDLLSTNPNDAEAITKIFDAAEKEAPKIDDVLRDLLPVYQKHLTLPEIQELNKF